MSLFIVELPSLRKFSLRLGKLPSLQIITSFAVGSIIDAFSSQKNMFYAIRQWTISHGQAFLT
jgi:hypothetical protein